MTTIIIGRELLEQALGQLICNTNNMQKGMSKSIQKLCARENAEVLERLRTALAAPATAPERKPMPILEVNARWEQSVLGITRLQYYQVVREVEAFHGIKEAP